MPANAKPSTDAPSLWPYAALALVLLIIGAAILILNGGTFIYTLDDPYIHLAFSEQLARGHFGLVAQELASPASSVLYPLLMLPLVGTALHEYQPLAWNIAAVGAALWLWIFLFDRLILSQAAGIVADQARTIAGVMAVLVLVLLNHAGLVFSGMEAGLQITLTLATTVGLIEFLFRGRLRWWLIAGIIAGPLIRYESLTVSLPAIVILAGFGRWRVAALCTAVVVVALGGYAVYCQSIGLPPVPGSLLVKGGFNHAQIGWLAGIVGDIKHVYDIVIHGRSDISVLLPIGLLALNFLLCPGGPQRSRERAVIGLALVVLVVQFIFGGHGSLGRYDTHAWCCGLAVASFANRSAIGRFVAKFGGLRSVVAGAAILICVFPYSVFMVVATPVAANGIYLQQFQMRRFLLDFARQPALANDVGLTAYRNPDGIVDVMGLGSEQIRRLRKANALDATALQRIAQARDAKLAMVYANWLGDALPPQWVAVGRLILQRPAISAAGRVVTIYALDAADIADLGAKLHEFAATLPSGATLEFGPAP